MRNQSSLYSVLLTGTLLPLSLWAQNKTSDSSRLPNIVFILADDLGWRDLGVMGSDYYETPYIDRLASEGALFTNAYAAAANSAPSRACMMTGLYTPRHGVFTVNPPDRGDKTKRRLIPIANKEDVATDFMTVAEALSTLGYQCGHVGKWHLGDDCDGTGPLSQGFVSNVGGNRAGSPYSYFYPYCNAAKTKCHFGLNDGISGEYLTDRLTREAIHFMQSHKDNPFFLHLSHHAVHTALQAPDSLINKYRMKPKGKYHTNPVYAAMIEKLDEGVGAICQAVETLGLSDNTVIVFYSDNGGMEPFTDNYPLRGGKGMPYEGGTRVPLIIKWPGKIKGGIRPDVSVTGVDFYPTFIKMANGTPEETLDGKDILSLMNQPDYVRDLFWHFPAYLESYQNEGSGFRATPYSSIRSGKWKLIYQYENEAMELFNLETDPGEMKNLAVREKKRCAQLYAKLNKWIEQTKAPIPTELNPYYSSLYHKPSKYFKGKYHEQNSY